MGTKNTRNPIEHTSNVKKEFRALIDHLRKDVEILEDPVQNSIFEVSSEVIIDLEKAFTDYEQ
jgi:hypothetical protein